MKFSRALRMLVTLSLVALSAPVWAPTNSNTFDTRKIPIPKMGAAGGGRI